MFEPAIPGVEMKPLAPPIFTRPSSSSSSTSPERKLKTPSTINIARATDPSSSDGAGLLLSLVLEQKGGVEYVPPSQRPLVAGLGHTPRKPGEKTAGLVKGGMAEMARKAIARAKQGTGLWAAERAGEERKRKSSNGGAGFGFGEPPELSVRVRSVVHVARGKGGFASLEPPPRAVLVKAKVQKVHRSIANRRSFDHSWHDHDDDRHDTRDANRKVAVGDEVFLLLGFGPNGPAYSASAEDCLQDLCSNGASIDVWPPWTQLATGVTPPPQSISTTGVTTVVLPAGRRISEIPLPSPLDGARKVDADAYALEAPLNEPIWTIFSERFAVVAGR
jgi:hypothetical protein